MTERKEAEANKTNSADKHRALLVRAQGSYYGESLST